MLRKSDHILAAKRVLKHSFSLLNIDYVLLDKQWNYKGVLSPYYRIYLIDKGKGKITNGKTSWILEPGFLYLVPSYTLCDLHCPDILVQYFSHFFEDPMNGISLFHNNRTVFKVNANKMDIAHFKRLLEINPNRKINRSDNPKIYEKNIYYKEYEELNNQQPYPVFLETQGLLLQLISRFMKPAHTHPAEAYAIPTKVVDLLGYIQLNLGQHLSVKYLAKLVNQHPDYLSRLFLQLTGERPLSYIHTKRIERAQYLIVTTNMTLAEISEATGFGNVPHFSKIFKKITNVTPAKYRERNNS